MCLHSHLLVKGYIILKSCKHGKFRFVSLLIVLGILASVCIYDAHLEKEKFHKALIAQVRNHAMPNTFIGAREVSGFNAYELKNKLDTVQKSIDSTEITILGEQDEFQYLRKKFIKQYYYKVTVNEGEQNQEYEFKDKDSLVDFLVGYSEKFSDQDLLDCIRNDSAFSKMEIVLNVLPDEDIIQRVTAKISTSESVGAVNACINEKGKFVKEKSGKTVDVEELKNTIVSFAASIDTTATDYQLRYNEVEPTCTVKDLKACKECIGQYTTTFTINQRGYNVALGAQRLNNLVVAPGASISVCDKVHDGSDGKDFKLAASYANGEVVQTKGGGICQVSSTLYNAILNAGILPEKRFAHSMPVHYVPLGLDATMSSGSKDLILKNEKSSPYVIKTSSDNGVLTAKIYAKKGFNGSKSFKTRTTQISSNKVQAYLDTYKNGELCDSLLLHTDTYR